MDNKIIGLSCQLAGCVIGLISLVAIVKHNPVVVTGLCLSAGLYFVGRHLKERF